MQLPPLMKTPAGYSEFLKELASDPARHNVLSPGLAFDPEVVLYLNYRADAMGWAHSMMVHGDGYASYITHKPAQLSHGVRWISRTPDQFCLGIVLPANAEPEGYHAEKAKGNVKVLGAGATVLFETEAGLLTPDEAKSIERKIEKLISGR
jgi:hypothetical protein